MILINLLPPEMRKKEVVKLSLPDLPSKKTVTRAIVIFLGIQIFLTIFSMYQHFFVMPSLQKETDALSVQLKEITDSKNQIVSMNGRLKQIREATSRRFYWSSLLNTLADSMTKGVWLNSLSIETPALVPKKAEKEKKNIPPAKTANKKGAAEPKEAIKKPVILKLKGTVYSPGHETASVGLFLKQLKSNRSFSDYFSEIELGNMSQRKIKEYDVYDFEINCRFKRDFI